jgi:hypothetical protein
MFSLLSRIIMSPLGVIVFDEDEKPLSLNLEYATE